MSVIDPDFADLYPASMKRTIDPDFADLVTGDKSMSPSLVPPTTPSAVKSLSVNVPNFGTAALGVGSGGVGATAPSRPSPMFESERVPFSSEDFYNMMASGAKTIQTMPTDQDSGGGILTAKAAKRIVAQAFGTDAVIHPVKYDQRTQQAIPGATSADPTNPQAAAQEGLDEVRYYRDNDPIPGFLHRVTEGAKSIVNPITRGALQSAFPLIGAVPQGQQIADIASKAATNIGVGATVGVPEFGYQIGHDPFKAAVGAAKSFDFWAPGMKPEDRLTALAQWPLALLGVAHGFGVDLHPAIADTAGKALESGGPDAAAKVLTDAGIHPDVASQAVREAIDDVPSSVRRAAVSPEERAADIAVVRQALSSPDLSPEVRAQLQEVHDTLNETTESRPSTSQPSPVATSEVPSVASTGEAVGRPGGEGVDVPPEGQVRAGESVQIPESTSLPFNEFVRAQFEAAQRVSGKVFDALDQTSDANLDKAAAVKLRDQRGLLDQVRRYGKPPGWFRTEYEKLQQFEIANALRSGQGVAKDVLDSHPNVDWSKLDDPSAPNAPPGEPPEENVPGLREAIANERAPGNRGPSQLGPGVKEGFNAPEGYRVLKIVSGFRGFDRPSHRRSANQILYDFLRKQPLQQFKLGETLGREVFSHMVKRFNPPETVWHHPDYAPDQLHLMTMDDHTNPEFQEYLHPGRRGGYVKNFKK